MFKELVLALRKCDHDAAKEILRKSSIDDLIESYTSQTRKSVCIDGNEDTIKLEINPSDHKLNVEILCGAIFRHVTNPEIIYELILAGMSPALLARIFISDPYRLSIVMRLLPVLAPQLEHEDLLEKINDNGGIKSVGDSKSYSATDLITRCALKFPVIYNNYTIDLQSLIHALYVQDLKIADDTNHFRILDKWIDTINRERAAQNKPALNIEADEKEINQLVRKAKKQADETLEKIFRKIYFALEVHDAMLNLGVQLRVEQSSAILRAFNQYRQIFRYSDLVLLSLFVVYLSVISYLLKIDAQLPILLPSISMATLQMYSAYKIHSILNPDKHDRFRYTPYSLYQVESYPFAAKASGMIENIRARHQAKDAAEFEEKSSNGLYFWRKVIAPAPNDDTFDTTPTMYSAQMKCKPE